MLGAALLLVMAIAAWVFLPDIRRQARISSQAGCGIFFHVF